MTAPADTFDPYRDWLGIQPHVRPLDHYRLLGIARFESDLALVAAAADERMALVRSFQVGPRRTFTQQLLNELSAARVCLLSATAKAAYDASLHGRMAGFQPVVPPVPLVAPPIQPPPPPDARVTIADHSEALDPDLIARPAPWWRPLASMLAMALLVLAAAAGWGIYQSTRPAAATNAAVIPAPPLPEEIEPEPPTQEPVVQFQEGSGEVNLSPATAVLQGGLNLQADGTQELLAGFVSPESAAQWQFRLAVPGFFELELQYATAPEVEAAALVAEIDGESKPLDLRPTGGLDEFRTDTFTIAIPKSGQHTLGLRPAGPLAGEGLILKSVRLMPVGTGSKGERGASVP